MWFTETFNTVPFSLLNLSFALGRFFLLFLTSRTLQRIAVDGGREKSPATRVVGAAPLRLGRRLSQVLTRDSILLPATTLSQLATS